MMSRSLVAASLSAVSTLCAVACHEADPVVVGGLHDVAVLPALPNRDLDLLFVIDNSSSMFDKQAALTAGFPRVIDKLSQLDGGLPNLHIGVITTDMGTKGSAVAEPGPPVPSGDCAGLGDDGALRSGVADLDGNFIVDVEVDGARFRNYAGELRNVFTALARVGDIGCAFEQPLASLRRSFENPANAGFLRSDANLAVIVLSDEDDCSLRDPALFASELTQFGPLSSFRCFRAGVVCDPNDTATPGEKQGCRPDEGSQFVDGVDDFVQAVLAQKADPRQVMVSALIGNPDHVEVELRATPGGARTPELAASCAAPSADGRYSVGYPGVRLAAFASAFSSSTVSSICLHDGNGALDFSEALDAIGETAKKLQGDPCIDTGDLVDSSPAPGIQPACEVTDVLDAAPGQPLVLSECTGTTTTDCYRIEADAAACPASQDHLRVRVQRSQSVASGTWTHVSCQRAL